jgi:hypothetical protein
VETLEVVTRALYIGKRGDMKVVLKSRDKVLLRNADVLYSLRAVGVLAMGTTAAYIVGMR